MSTWSSTGVDILLAWHHASNNMQLTIFRGRVLVSLGVQSQICAIVSEPG